jgi:hypothetical protein
MQKCKFCQEPIGFRKSKKGKWYPVNQNGRPHFLTCKHHKIMKSLVSYINEPTRIKRNHWLMMNPGKTLPKDYEL